MRKIKFFVHLLPRLKLLAYFPQNPNLQIFSYWLNLSASFGSLLGESKNSDLLPEEKLFTDLWHLLITFILSLTFWVPVVSASSLPNSSSHKFYSSFSRTPYNSRYWFFLYLFAFRDSLWLSYMALWYSFRSFSILLLELGGVFYLWFIFKRSRELSVTDWTKFGKVGHKLVLMF